MENIVEEKIQSADIKALRQQCESGTGGGDILFIVLLTKNFEFKNTHTPYDIEICGKKMWEWVALAGEGCKIKTTVCTEESDVLSLIKPHLVDECEYTAVFYSDTPLLQRGTFVDIMNFVKAKQANVVKLKRGYVFNTNYIKFAENIKTTVIEEFGTNDFTNVSNQEKLMEVTNVLKNRIINYHISNGVIIEDKASTFIDADVIIEDSVKIKPNNCIYGSAYIGKNCVLEPYNVIKNSVISENCIMKFSYIEESRISENLVVGPFECIIKKSL